MTLSQTTKRSRLPFLTGAALLGAALATAQPVKVGETRAFRASSLDLARASEAGLTVEETGAQFLKLHFTGVSLPGRSRIVIRGGDGQVAYLSAGDIQGGEAWAHSVDGDRAVVTLEAEDPAASFAIDSYAYGFPDLSEALLDVESTFGTDDKRDRQCFPGSYKYNNAAAVGRMRYISGGTAFVCTGTLVSHLNHFITNNHCVATEAEVDTLEVRFNFERTTCGGGVNKVFQTVGSAANQLVRTNAGLDFTLLTLAGNPAATYGYLALNGENLRAGDPLYIIQHPGGFEKKIHARHTGTAGEDCVVKFGDWSEPGYNANASIQHTCDTEGGSSGSPVLNDNNQIVALHHTGYLGSPAQCSANGGPGAPCNGAIEMEHILPLIRSDLPADRGGAGGGSGWVWYRSQEAWRYTAGNSERMWANFNGTTTTAWVDAKAQPTLTELVISGAQSGHWLGLFWTSASTWTNARLWYQ